MSTVEFIEYCINQHDVVCNQKYSKTLPYSFHLELVAKQVKLFEHLLGSSDDKQLVLMGAWGHDLIEDARVTWNDIVHCTNALLYENSVILADIIYACTELRGKNRAERHGDEYITGLANNRLALFVKLCDIIANIKFSLLTNSGMYAKYAEEFPAFSVRLWREEYSEMFEYAEKLLTINKLNLL